ncbi:hypothetical protein CSUB01_00550 [Colletotrichum sublineola]|uniref:Uncharacterized protein n=1 Tax=Colletotrichum sublineola TaxID=1173701 RepID=A0A066WYD7_COLSU|nr:hypothetical protein CSUB01_00550 [Colletotrichum sublineola]
MAQSVTHENTWEPGLVMGEMFIIPHPVDDVVLRREPSLVVIIKLPPAGFPDESQVTLVPSVETLFQLGFRSNTASTGVRRPSERVPVLGSREADADAPDVLPSSVGILTLASPTKSQLGHVPVYIAIAAFEPPHRHVRLALVLFDSGDTAR